MFPVPPDSSIDPGPVVCPVPPPPDPPGCPVTESAGLIAGVGTVAPDPPFAEVIVENTESLPCDTLKIVSYDHLPSEAFQMFSVG